jgi:transposase
MSKQIDWAAEVAVWRASGKTAREFCEERGYAATRLYWWSSQLKRSQGVPAGKTEVRLARVVRKSGATDAVQRPPIVIQVGQARVEVRADADRGALSLVLQSLVSVTWGDES